MQFFSSTFFSIVLLCGITIVSPSRADFWLRHWFPWKLLFQTVKNDHKSSYICGPDLCKFYSRPVDVKFKPNDIIDTNVEYGPENEKFAIVDSPTPPAQDKNSEVSFISVGTQTDYRESEAQTDPWDPPYVVHSAFKEPEILKIKELTYGNGLPATQTEIDYILKIRENIELDIPYEGLPNYERKKQKAVSQIQNEWNYKITKQSERLVEKLKQMESSLTEELSKKSERHEKLLKNIWTQKNEQMTKMNAKLQKELKKELKGLERKSKNGTQKFDAKAYGLNTSAKDLAKYINKNKESLNQDIDKLISKYHMNPNGLSKLTEWLERKRTHLYNEIPLAKPFHKDRKDRVTEKAYQDLHVKKRIKLPPKIYHEDYDKEETVASPLRSEAEFEVIELPEEGVDLVTVWQQILRGRAYQKQMLELIDKHKDALDILLTSEVLGKI